MTKKDAPIHNSKVKRFFIQKVGPKSTSASTCVKLSLNKNSLSPRFLSNSQNFELELKPSLNVSNLFSYFQILYGVFVSSFTNNNSIAFVWEVTKSKVVGMLWWRCSHLLLSPNCADKFRFLRVRLPQQFSSELDCVTSVSKLPAVV